MDKKPYRIGIDARLYFQTGVGVYIRNFLHYLQLQAPDTIDIYIYVLTQDARNITFTNPHFIKREVTAKWHSFAEQLVFCNDLMKDNLDLMHFTYFSYPVLYRRPFIATIHDVTPLLFKTGKASTLPSVLYDFKYEVFKFVLSQQVKNAKAIITPTESVKHQLVEIYGKQYQNRISVLYEGVNYEFFNVQANDGLKKIFTRPFFLYVGNFYPHKNVDRLITAFHKLGRGDIDLVLAGPDNYFAARIRQYIQQYHINNIHLYHQARSEDLVFLYKNSKALINPSLSEGFGLPIVESLYCRTPVIASDIPVFKELMGDEYISFDPMDVESIKSALASFLARKEHTIPPLNKKFSFEHMVQKYLDLLQELL